jgi:hypothetical protein
MRLIQAFNIFSRQGRIVNLIIVNPADVEDLNYDYSYNSNKKYKWTAEIQTDASIPSGEFQLVSEPMPPLNELRQTFNANSVIP